MLPSPLTSPYSFSLFAVDPLRMDGETMPVAKPPSAVIVVVLAACDCVKQPVNVVADGIDVIATVSDVSPSSVVNHSPTNMPDVDVTVAVTGTAQGETPAIAAVSVTLPVPGSAMRPAWPTSCWSSSVAPRT